MMASIILVLFIIWLMASGLLIPAIFVEIYGETDSVLESLAATLCIILLAWILFAVFVGVIAFPYYFITVLLS